MPLDGHTYLVNQGWGGKGTALREGALSRPLAIPKKKTLAGLGKDRDEAFPFWDHLFSAAAKSIQVKCSSDDEASADSNPERTSALKRTSTGILSNRRPVEGTPARSGSSTPLPQQNTPQLKLSLVATAKRDAAKRGLYSRFFRGPVLGPESLADEERRLTALVSEALSGSDSFIQSVKVNKHLEIGTKNGTTVVDLEVSHLTKKKRRKVNDEGQAESDGARKERKRQRKEEKHAKRKKEETKLARREKKARKLNEVAEEEPQRQTEPTRVLDKPKAKSSKTSKKSLSDLQDCDPQKVLKAEKRKKKRKREDSVQMDET